MTFKTVTLDFKMMVNVPDNLFQTCFLSTLLPVIMCAHVFCLIIFSRGIFLFRWLWSKTWRWQTSLWYKFLFTFLQIFGIIMEIQESIMYHITMFQVMGALVPVELDFQEEKVALDQILDILLELVRVVFF